MSEEHSDIVLLGAKTEDGGGTHVLRVTSESVTVGQVRPLEDGKPIAGEVVKLTPLKDAPRICAVETIHEPPVKSEHRGRPAQVASAAYRAGWDAIFAGKPN